MLGEPTVRWMACPMDAALLRTPDLCAIKSPVFVFVLPTALPRMRGCHSLVQVGCIRQRKFGTSRAILISLTHGNRPPWNYISGNFTFLAVRTQEQIFGPTSAADLCGHAKRNLTQQVLYRVIWCTRRCGACSFVLVPAVHCRRMNYYARLGPHGPLVETAFRQTRRLGC